MNNFGLLFEYLNNIRIFILLNKLPILAQKSKKLGRNIQISCFTVDLHSKGSTNYKIGFLNVFCKFFGEIVWKFTFLYGLFSKHLLFEYSVKNYSNNE
jgi:hypothetical protein